ncbi:hypothetical protein [Haloferula helveola]
MSSKTKKTNKGKRYTDQEKAEILAYVEEVNSAKGRGGQSAASKKYKISPLTISSWLKSAGAAPKKKRGRKAKAVKVSATGGSIEKKLAKLQSLHKEIARTESTLAKLQSQFESLKASL